MDSITGLLRRADATAESLDGLGICPVAALIRELAAALQAATAPAPTPEDTAPADYPSPYRGWQDID